MSGVSKEGDRPLATCTRHSCTDCPVRGRVTCHFTNVDRAVFSASALPAFVVAFYGLSIVHWSMVAAMAVLVVAYFGVIEVWAMCSHCPHYAEPGTRTLRCWANYGCPKLRGYRPGPMSGTEKAAFAGGMATVMGFPALVFAASAMTPFVIAYGVSLAALFSVLRGHFCKRCMNIACPLNRLDAASGRAFKEMNPATEGPEG